MNNLLIRKLNNISLCIAFSVIDALLFVLFIFLANGYDGSTKIGLILISVSFILMLLGNIDLLIKGIIYGHKLIFKFESNKDKRYFVINLIFLIIVIISIALIICGLILMLLFS